MIARLPILKKLAGKLARPPRELAMFFATSVAARGIGIVCQMIQVPIVMHSLGAEAFGLWMTVVSLTSFASFADFGMGIGVQNRVAEAFAHEQMAEARELFSTAFLFLSAIAIVLAAGLGAVVACIDFASVFRLSDPETIAQAPGAALALVLLFCAGFPFGLAQRLAFGRQAGWMINVTQAGGSLAALAMVAVAAALGWGLAAMVAGAQGMLVLANVVLLASQLGSLRWSGPELLVFRLALLRELLRLGTSFSVQQVMTGILFSLPQVIISAFLGAAAVTPYNLVQRLFNLFAVIQNAFMLPLWPAYSKAKAKREFDWMRRTLRHSIRATAVCVVAPMAVGAWFAGDIIHLWVGGSAAAPEAALVWLLFLWNAIVFFQQPFSYLLAGVSEIRRVAYYSVFSAVSSLALMWMLARPLGAPGVALGLILGYVPFSFLGTVLESRRYLRVHRSGPETPRVSPAWEAHRVNAKM